ncbi:MAG: hypothetical protein GXO58_02340 [Thermodesulfobacteria bacterium]|nr:hypothetical protein [Thermodesulfobacteriota bacterium]
MIRPTLGLLSLVLLVSALVGAVETARGQRGLYPPMPKKLTRKQCMECHPLIFKMLKTNGAAHSRVACRQCHTTFHTYIPGKTKYEDVLPKCTRCHDHPHGEELTACTSCHSEAHTPLDIPASLSLAKGCHVCHPKIAKEINTYFTQHTELYCTACHHTKHGYIPQCLECHQPHKGLFPDSEGFMWPVSDLANCLMCHSPHKALNVTYPDDTPNTTCGLCHRKAYEMLKKSHAKHSKFRCTKCHPKKHKTIKRCRQCHGEPHPQAMIRKFGSCGKCHGVAHSIIR